MNRIKTYINRFNHWLLYQLNKNEQASGTLEMVLIIVDNPFTSSTYILSY